MRPIPLDLGVAAIVLRDSKILLVQEAKGPHEGQWGLPKGYVNPGELPASAVVRELHEECGINGTVTGICGVRECVRNELARIFIAYTSRLAINHWQSMSMKFQRLGLQVRTNLSSSVGLVLPCMSWQNLVCSMTPL